MFFIKLLTDDNIKYCTNAIKKLKYEDGSFTQPLNKVYTVKQNQEILAVPEKVRKYLIDIFYNHSYNWDEGTLTASNDKDAQNKAEKIANKFTDMWNKRKRSVGRPGGFDPVEVDVYKEGYLNESFKVGDKVKFVDKGSAHFDKKGKVIRDHGDGSYSVEILFPSGRTLTPNNVKNKDIVKEEVLDEGVKLAHLVGQSIAHLGMYVELAEDIKKEYFKTNSQVSMFIKAKADQVLKNVPKLVKELRRPGIWSEQVDKADNAVKFWEDKQLDEALRDMEDYREKSKVLQSIQNDPKQMKDPQMRTAVMKRKLKLSQELSDLRAKQARQKPIAAEVEPGTYVKEEKTPQEKSKILVQIDKIKNIKKEKNILVI